MDWIQILRNPKIKAKVQKLSPEMKKFFVDRLMEDSLKHRMDEHLRDCREDINDEWEQLQMDLQELRAQSRMYAESRNQSRNSRQSRNQSRQRSSRARARSEMTIVNEENYPEDLPRRKKWRQRNDSRTPDDYDDYDDYDDNMGSGYNNDRQDRWRSERNTPEDLHVDNIDEGNYQEERKRRQQRRLHIQGGQDHLSVSPGLRTPSPNRVGQAPTPQEQEENVEQSRMLIEETQRRDNLVENQRDKQKDDLDRRRQRMREEQAQRMSFAMKLLEEISEMDAKLAEDKQKQTKQVKARLDALRKDGKRTPGSSRHDDGAELEDLEEERTPPHELEKY